MAHEAAHALEHALALSGSMTWEILWALILGFTLSAVVQAVVRRSTIVALLGDDRPRTLAVAAGLGAASSSCSYAAVALARSLFRKGANFTAAEFVGGPLMIVALAVLFRLFVRTRLVDAARRQADRGLAGSMEGHAAMDMSVQREGSFWQRLLSREGFTSVAHVFVMEWAAILRDLVVGLLIAGAIAAWVPESFWQHFFFADHPVLSAFWGPIVGPMVAIVSFVCSIGNVPLAAVLWNGGISFGGVVAFIFADLLILPILNIYRKYYGTKMMLTLLGTFYAAMVTAGYIVELLFGAAGLIPSQRNATVMEAGISWNYTSWLNIAFLVLAAVLGVRFVKTGGLPMLRAMGGSPGAEDDHCQHNH